MESENEKKIGNAGKEGTKIQCHHCGYIWIYTGNKNEYTPCPKCTYKVNIQKQKMDEGN